MEELDAAVQVPRNRCPEPSGIDLSVSMRPMSEPHALAVEIAVFVDGAVEAAAAIGIVVEAAAAAQHARPATAALLLAGTPVVAENSKKKAAARPPFQILRRLRASG
jgi:hypothetical protein